MLGARPLRTPAWLAAMLACASVAYNCRRPHARWPAPHPTRPPSPRAPTHVITFPALVQSAACLAIARDTVTPGDSPARPVWPAPPSEQVAAAAAAHHPQLAAIHDGAVAAAGRWRLPRRQGTAARHGPGRWQGIDRAAGTTRKRAHAAACCGCGLTQPSRREAAGLGRHGVARAGRSDRWHPAQPPPAPGGDVQHCQSVARAPRADAAKHVDLAAERRKGDGLGGGQRGAKRGPQKTRRLARAGWGPQRPPRARIAWPAQPSLSPRRCRAPGAAHLAAVLRHCGAVVAARPRRLPLHRRVAPLPLCRAPVLFCLALPLAVRAARGPVTQPRTLTQRVRLHAVIQLAIGIPCRAVGGRCRRGLGSEDSSCHLGGGRGHGGWAVAGRAALRAGLPFRGRVVHALIVIGGAILVFSVHPVCGRGRPQPSRAGREMAGRGVPAGHRGCTHASACCWWGRRHTACRALRNRRGCPACFPSTQSPGTSLTVKAVCVVLAAVRAIAAHPILLLLPKVLPHQLHGMPCQLAKGRRAAAAGPLEQTPPQRGVGLAQLLARLPFCIAGRRTGCLVCRSCRRGLTAQHCNSVERGLRQVAGAAWQAVRGGGEGGSQMGRRSCRVRQASTPPGQPCGM